MSATRGADRDIPFAGLEPDLILDAVQSLGLRCDGRLLAMNSYENRVYRIGLEDGEPVVAKFYRPHRWSDETIVEELDFTVELAAAEVPVVAPLRFGAAWLHHHQGFRFALFPMRAGRLPELDQPAVLSRIGRFLGRLHGVGAARRFRHRPSLEPRRLGHASRQLLLEGDWIPEHLQASYASVSEDLLARVDARFGEAGDLRQIRLHGDCHAGNLLLRDDRLLLVDLDDTCTGPAIQDLWLFLGGAREEQESKLRHLLAGYTEMYDFDSRELLLIEALRSLRIVHYAAWLARRWSDPAFPRAFPWFAAPRFWDEHVLALREQIALVQEPAIAWVP